MCESLRGTASHGYVYMYICKYFLFNYSKMLEYLSFGSGIINNLYSKYLSYTSMLFKTYFVCTTYIVCL